jgi:pimeloyl-ACP methyl ester carboxylesterase
VDRRPVPPAPPSGEAAPRTLGDQALGEGGVGEAGPVRDGGCLNAAGSVELGQDIRYIDAGGLVRDESSAASVTIAAARADQAQHLDLPRRQAEVPLSLASGRPGGDAEAGPPGQRPDLFTQRGRPPAAAELRQRSGLRANRPGGMVDIPAGLDRITCPVLIMQGTADSWSALQPPRFLAFIPPRAVPMAPRLQLLRAA